MYAVLAKQGFAEQKARSVICRGCACTIAKPKFRPSMGELHSQIVAAQERALYYACELRSCAPFR